jgi:hypothetical protein
MKFGNYKSSYLLTVPLVLYATVLNIFLLPKLDVDTYHDGFIYPMAFLANEGGSPNLNFFSMYGPLGPILQGKWLEMFGVNLLSLRLHGAFLILVIGLLSFIVMKQFVSNNLALLLITIWLIGNPLVVHPSLPWVDLYTSLILLITFSYVKINEKKLGSWQFYLIGAILGFGVMAKINFLVVLSLILLGFLFFFGMKTSVMFMLGSFSSTLMCLILMFFNGSLPMYLEQGIRFTFTMHDENKSLRGIINIKIIAFGILFFLLLTVIRNLTEKLDKKRFAVNIVTGLVILVSIFVTLNFRELNKPFTSLTMNMGENVLNVLKNSPYTILFASVFGTLISALALALKRDKYEFGSSEKILMVGSLGAMGQLYPNPEPGHVWYVFPIAILGLLPWAKIFSNFAYERLVEKLILLPVVFSLLVVNMQYLSVIRTPHLESPLIGMFSRPEQSERIDTTLRLLQLALQDKNTTVQYNCSKGIFSVAGNRYLGSDYQYVDIIPKFFVPKKKSEYTFECEISMLKLKEIASKAEIIFAVDGELPSLKNTLYRTVQQSNP